MAFSFSEFFQDIKTSRYAQVWLLLWIVMLIVLLVGTVHFGKIARDDYELDTYKLQLKLREALNYPDFTIRVLNENRTAIDSISCVTAKNDVVQLQPCPSYQKEKCMDTTNAKELTANVLQNGLRCLINQRLLVPDTPGGVSLSFDKNLEIGKTAYIHPGERVDIFLNVVELTPRKEPRSTVVQWDASFAYTSTQETTPGVSEVNIKFASFIVNSWIAYDNYTGWMAFADLFGTFFGLYLLHAFVMLVVGFVIPNDAKSLGGGDRAYPNM